ncbi:exo-alpha-sialidase [Mucilaginibacter sp. 21P]|uniref:sialidase family protein n=1 Tax=Mucilaginibacter sp. 21P TaxID=2778902 RepID=UPI001C5A38E8|nr:sialidase family protein [Mucilaginibacter sp. 21P]
MMRFRPVNNVKYNSENDFNEVFYVSLVLLLFFGGRASVAQDVPVFVSGNDGFKSFRIPAIIKLPNNDLIGFCEGRVNNAGDFGNVKIVSKISKDNGLHWGALNVVVSNDALQANNPGPVVDKNDPRYPSGRVFLFYNTGDKPENEIRKGQGLREVWYITSVDNGLTWSAPVNIASQVHKPNQPQINSAYNYPEDWRSYANGPGHAIQLTQGRFKGRIYVAANHSSGKPQKNYADGRIHGFYTDDHGGSFKLSNDVNISGGNESMAVELTVSRLMINARNQLGDIKQRIVALSNDGGKTWNKTYFDKQLPDPVCQGSIINIGLTGGKAMLAFCNARDTVNRDNLTLRISKDSGETWPIACTIAKAPQSYKGDYAAYSDLVKLSDKHLGVIYEKDNYSEIVFKSINWSLSK